MCTPGEVLNVALPAGLKLSSESRIGLYPGFQLHESEYEFSDREELILSTLNRREELSYTEVSKVLGIKTIHPTLKSLIAKQAIFIFEHVSERYRPKYVKRVRIHPQHLSVDSIEEIASTLEKRQGQLAILSEYLKIVDVFTEPELNDSGLEKSYFIKSGFSASSLKTLIKNEVLEEIEVEVSRIQTDETQSPQEVVLTPDQLEVRTQIHQEFSKNKPVLLHGVTGSGKTELYVQLIKEALESESQVLYMLPEIALTTQIVSRLQKIFGSEMGVYHSRFSDAERVEIWKKVAKGELSFVVGVRSSLFLPFDNLGLIIIDEEHDPSYKQFEPAPRYNARDAAIYLGQKHGAQVLLGSATPSMESFFNASTGKFGLVQLLERFGDAKLPDFVLANSLREKRRKTMQNEFTSVLKAEIEESLAKDKQVIIFQNRRGYAPYVECQACGDVPKCPNCSVSLTFHMYSNELRCHYCGHSQKIPIVCESCGENDLQTKNFGTEKLEETLNLMFQEARVQRMDFDTTRTKKSYQQIIDAFQSHEVDILVGTQMVSKGLDFEGVRLVGIFDTDRMMHFPDFRASERTFQLITQVSGRAGRRQEQGRVVIQTSDPENILIKRIVNHDYIGFYNKEISERRLYHYPPFVRLIEVTIRHQSSEECKRAALMLELDLKKKLAPKMIIGPQEALIPRIRNRYHWQLLIKIGKHRIDLGKAKAILKDSASNLLKNKSHKGTSIIFDVDPA